MNITTIQDHITILRAHNEWRRGGDGPMTNPKALGIAIEAVCGELEAMQRQFETTRKGRTAPANLREQVNPAMWPTPRTSSAMNEDAAALLPDCAVLSDAALRRLALADAARRGFGAGDVPALRGLRDRLRAAPEMPVGEGDPTERG
jgi:hypothetical protein